MNKEKSAVDWLFEQMPFEYRSSRAAFEAYKIALEMEKQFLIGFYIQAAMKDNKLPYGIQYYGKLEEVTQEAEDLYNETFNNQQP